MGVIMRKTVEEQVRNCLQKVKLPQNGADIVQSGMVSAVQVDGNGGVIVVLEVDPEQGAALEVVRQEAERSVLQVKGVSTASVILTAETKKDVPESGKTTQPDPHGMAKNPVLDLPVRHIIVVASGKGGVGKSTVAANLAVCLADINQLSTGLNKDQDGRSGSKMRVGLLDADIYGPSQPMMMGDEAYKPELDAEKKLIPLEKHGVKTMSIGFMVDREKALVWRGPMVQSAFYQMLRDVAWGSEEEPLDYLVIDMPPGTGDVQLTLAQKVKASGAVIVTTPQDIALLDARRAVEMFEKTNVPVLGLVENMAVHVCSNCGHEEHIFGQNDGSREAERLGITLLGSLPLAKNIRMQGDAGVPISVAEPDGAEAKGFAEIAARVNGVLA